MGVSAAPYSGLVDGQYIKINFVNLQPFEAMVFRQCIALPLNVSTDCTPVNTRILGFADQTGSGGTFFPVYAYANDLLKNAAGVPIPCDAKNVCSVLATTNYHHTYIVQVSFAPSPAACPPVGPSAVTGSGAAGATRAMFKWSAATCVPPKSVTVSYITGNEHDAYDNFARGLTEFGVTGLGPYPPKESGGPTFKLAPLTVSGVVIAYRAYDQNGSQITNLTLTPDLIAGLFMGQISNFAATRAITALNPGIAFPPRTSVVARAEFNSETYILNQWLTAAAPTVWKPPAPPSPDIFPATGIDLKFGERADAIDIVDPPNGFDTSVVYVGVVDSTTAAFYGLPTAKIRMPNGATLSATPDSILKAVNDSVQLPDGTLVPQWANFADPAAWPMPNVTYLIAPTSAIDPVRGRTIATFLRFAVQDGQQMLGGVDGYVRLPVALAADSLAVADRIPVPAPPPSPVPSPPQFNRPALPGQVPGPGGGSSGASSQPGASTVASETRVATLTYGQGVGLTAAAQQQSGVPPQFALPTLLGLTVLSTVIGVGLQAWAVWAARQP